MTDAPAEIASIPVHIRSSDVHLDGARPRPRRALRTNTYTLTAAAPVALALPQSDTRVQAFITAATSASPPTIYVSTSQATAQAAGGGAAAIAPADMPCEFDTTDPVWIYASTGYPVTVSVWAIYED